MTSSDDHAPKPECICGEINARHCPVHNEPDASREWWIDEGVNEIVPPGKQSKFDVHVIEKSAYDALQKRCERLEAAFDDECHKLRIKENELAAAKAEVADMQAGNFERMKVRDNLRDELIQANARIKALEAHLDDARSDVYRQGKALDIVLAREQPLVEALEDISERTVDGPDAWDVARRALKKQRGGL